MTNAKDCIIHLIYANIIDQEYHTNLYCERNCQWKCLKGKPYKRGARRQVYH